MKYSIETTENGVNETLEVDGNLYKKEWEREVTGLFRCKQKNFTDQMEKDGFFGSGINCKGAIISRRFG